MAITVNQTPQQFQPVYNPYIIVMSSDNSGEDNFKILLGVYDNTDVNNSSQITILQNPTNTDGYAVFDLSRIVRDYVTHDFELGVALTSNCPNSIKRITCLAQEVFGTIPSPTGSITTIGAATTTSSLYLWNGSLEFDTFASYSKNDYLLKYSNINSNKWLTRFDVSTGFDMSLNQNGYCHLLCESLDGSDNVQILVDSVKIKTYTSAGTLIDTYEVNVDYNTDFDTTTGYMIRVPIGTYNISQINALDFISGSQPVFTNSVAYYTVQPVSALYGDGYPLRVNIVDYCDSPKMFRLHWLNRLGGFDSFNFSKYYTENSAIQRVGYKRPYGTVSAGSWSYNKSDNQKVNMINTLNKTYTIQTDWISESELAVMEELLTSPVVYYEQDATNLVSVNVVDTSFESKYHHKDKVFNLTLTIELTYDYKSQTY